MVAVAAEPSPGPLEALLAREAPSFGERPPAREELERALEAATAAVRGSLERNGGLDPAAFDDALAGLSHEFVEYRGRRVHLEVHDAGPDAPTVVAHHGLGDHVRRMTPLAARLRGEGFNVVMMDRPGHGLSEGRRGHCPLPWAFELVDESVRLARERFGGPVVLLGDSLGGITLWYALTRDQGLDAEAVVCHCILNPAVTRDRALVVKAPLMRVGARIFPHARVPITQIADYDHVALDPVTKDYFDRWVDPVFTFDSTLASAASYLGFRPDRPWESANLPVLAVIGADDWLTSTRVNRESFERAHPPRGEYLELAGVGHQMFLDHLEVTFPPLLDWTRRALGTP